MIELKRILKFTMVYLFVVVLFYFIGGEQLRYTVIQEPVPQLTNSMPELAEDATVEQSFESKVDIIDKIYFYPHTFSRENEGIIEALILSGNEVISQTLIDASTCTEGIPFILTLEEPVEVERGGVYSFKMIFHCKAGKSPTLIYSDKEDGQYKMIINGVQNEGELSLQVMGRQKEIFGTYYWIIMFVLFLLISAYYFWCKYQNKRGKWTIITLFSFVWKKYNFLITQLVSRDFKIKYKRSILGYCWSFLNPLLTMLIQYIVFSQIFTNDIENFPVYLLAGNIIFGFFTEAVGQGLNSIIYNSSLISKVYVPKYIYPATKVMSSAINLVISIVPLVFVTLITGGRVNFTLFLIPYVLVCLLLFSMGVVLALCAINVFFRDVQYLWGIISLIWMYATPIFYPAEIIPENLKFIQTINPLYHIITFTRTILIEGVSPSPKVYLFCLVSAIVSFLIGATIFKKTQNKFILYI